MRTGRLSLKLYLFSVAAVLATVGMVIATSYALQSEHRQDMRAASGYIVRSLWHEHTGATKRESATLEARFPGVQVTFYDSGGRLVVSTAEPPLPRPTQSDLNELRAKGVVDVSHGVMAHEVRNGGGVEAIGVLKLGRVPSLPTLAQFVVMVLAALLAGALVFARRLALPLQRVAAVAKKFGEGDLTARVATQRNDEIGEVGGAFDAMAERVASLMAGQQELMANVSHELRTPLSRIQVAVDLITDGKVEQAKELTPDIAKDLAELDRLIDDVMTVAKLDLSRSGEAASTVPLRIEALPIGTLIDEALARFRSQHPTRELAIELDAELPELRVDPVLLRRVVDNLLDNAHKFSDRGMAIHLSARSTRSGVTIAITDRGIGIDEADMQKVFVPFFRSDRSRSRATGGVGLGLALARRVIEAHKGTIEITSTLGRGTTVSLVLPAELSVAHPLESQPS
jgi:two-component system, OmpR family, sensor kinase